MNELSSFIASLNEGRDDSSSESNVDSSSTFLSRLLEFGSCLNRKRSPSELLEDFLVPENLPRVRNDPGSLMSN